MKRMVSVLAVLAASAAVSAAVATHGSEAASAAAQTQRTFVSTSGSDTNPCTAAEPCRTFQAALANTLPGGEVVAVDSGGYGPFTVDKSVTIAGAPGEHVAISVFSGDGIVVNAAPLGDTVVLRNLYLTGLGGDHGIVFQDGDGLELDSVVVGGFALQGLLVTDGNFVYVRDSSFRRNGAEGVLIGHPLRVEIVGSSADRNGASGFSVHSGADGSIVRTSSTSNENDGFRFHGTRFSLSDSVADANEGNGVQLSGDGASVHVTSSLLTNNVAAGLRTTVGMAFEVPTARVSASTVTGNAVGLHRDAGTLETYGDNLVRGNTANLSGTITAVAKS